MNVRRFFSAPFMYSIVTCFISLFLFALSAKAIPFDKYYNLTSYSCVTSTGSKIEYDKSANQNAVIETRNGFSRSYWNYLGQGYIQSLNQSELRFTGHAPSAGPSLDPAESDYFMQFNELFKDHSTQKADGLLLESVAYGPRFIISKVTCIVDVKDSF